MLNFLLENGAQPNPSSKPSVTAPIIIAAKRGFVEIIQKLLEFKVSANFQDATGRAPLHYICWHGYSKSIPILLKYGAQVDLPDFEGNTPLHYACWLGSVEICTTLLQAGASIDVQDQAGRTPLYYSVQHKHPDTVSLLLQYHSNPTIQTCNGITPESLANQEGIVDIVEIFQKYNKEQLESKKKSGKDDNPANEEIISDYEGYSNMFAKDFNEEHNKMKSTINKLVEGRDEHVYVLQTLYKKLDEHNSTLLAIQTNMSETLDQLSKIEQILKGVCYTVNAMTETRPGTRSSNGSQSAISIPTGNLTNSVSGAVRSPAKSIFLSPVLDPIDQSQKNSQPIQTMPNQSMPPLQLNMCKLCKVNQATMRCKICRAPFCKQCYEKSKQTGCPFCHQLSGKGENK